MQLNNERGNILLYLMGLIVAAMTIEYVALNVIHVGYKTAITAERRVEADVLANDLLELTKYLMFYEDIVYTDGRGPWDKTGARRSNIWKLLGNGLGSGSGTDVDWFKACGGFDAKGNQMGQFQVGGVPVFCPYYLRSSLLSGDMLDQMALQPMLSAGVLTQDKPGQYVLKFVYYDRSKGIDSLTNNSDHLLNFNIGQNIFKDKRIQSATATVRLLSSASGFSDSTSARYLEISTEVILSDTASTVHSRQRQSMLIYPASPRDFALFMIYPTKSDGATPTNKWSESMKISAGSVIDGRVLFNGNIDVPLAQLPTFTEMVVITGDFVPALTKDQRKLLPTKFLKGLITNFSAPRFLLSGNCSVSNPQLTIANGSGFNCTTQAGTKATILDYLNKIGGKCIAVPIRVSSGTMTVDCSNSDSQCVLNCTPQPIVAGPRSNVTLSGSYALISAPVARLINSADNIYGTILGGYFESPNPVHIVSMSAAKIGMPGLGSDEILTSDTSLYQQSSVGVSVPLPNFSIVYLNGISK